MGASGFYEAFKAHTQTIVALVALVGSRIYSVNYRQSLTYPAIRVTRTGQPETDVTLTGPTGITTSTFQIEVADSEQNAAGGNPLKSALVIADMLAEKPANDGFNGFTGLLGVAPDDLQVGVMLLTNQFETYDPDELRVLRVIQTWRVQLCS